MFTRKFKKEDEKNRFLQFLGRTVYGGGYRTRKVGSNWLVIGEDGGNSLSKG